MMLRNGGLSRRDAFLLLIGASSMYIWSLLFSEKHTSFTDALPQINTVDHTITNTQIQTQTRVVTRTSTATLAIETPYVAYGNDVLNTSVLAHAPGWTLFRNLYMSNGTLFLVADQLHQSKFPEIRRMASHPLEAVNDPDNIAAREPSDLDMTFITPEEAQTRWGDRVLSVEGNTILSNDPKQFLRHYYHFVAELFFGVQAFWHGFFSSPANNTDSHFSFIHPSPPPIHRILFAYSNADGWRDNPGFNSYFLRGTLPSISVEHEEDWNDRVSATRSNTRAWRFPLVLLTDRSAAHRGVICGSQTQRTAAEAWDYMRLNGKLSGLHVGGWWAPLREAMWRFAGADVEFHNLGNVSSSSVNLEAMESNVDSSDPTIVNISPEAQKQLPMPQKVVLTYVDRQTAHSRNLIEADNSGLIQSVKELVDRKNEERRVALDLLKEGEEPLTEKRQEQIPLEWEFNIMQAGILTKDEQVRAAARTTIMFGLHGNGLTHLVWMQPNRISTVIEIFCPQGFAHDYYWTSRALGMAHFAVWNDTSDFIPLELYDSYTTYPDKPPVKYPKCFQGKEIPVHGPTISQLIEDRVSGKL
ncbi:hypothetical protein BYT27DRAFT_7232134 [Phlegmacium glaucopus]|nr:hypothetical protein BYT27DRAFT_7232134 [Phlegmacium glaucopus]